MFSSYIRRQKLVVALPLQQTPLFGPPHHPGAVVISRNLTVISRTPSVTSTCFARSGNGLPVWQNCWRNINYNYVTNKVVTSAGPGLLLTKNYSVHVKKKKPLSVNGRTEELLRGVTVVNTQIPLTQTRFKGGYSKFGHNEPPTATFTVLWSTFLLIALTVVWIDWQYVGEKLGLLEEKKPRDTRAGLLPKVEAAELSKQNELAVSKEEEVSSEGDVPSKKGVAKLGFRDRKIIEYENRIRQYSTPDKTFRYFATLQVIHPSGDNEVFMTPDDFLRSITPGIKQPEGLGLDQFKRYDPKLAGRLELELNPDSIFYKLGSHGLISFSDYIFLLTVLSTSRRHFEIAFRMFDLNGDGDVDVEEFEKVTALIRQRTSVGARHRELSASSNSLRETNSALNSYFFGVTRRDKLTIEKFLDFQQQLQTEILNLEFRRKGPDDNGKISESDFAELLLAYAGYPAKRKARMLKRVKRKSKEEGYATGVSLDDYLKFFHLLSNIQDVDTALTFYHIAGAAIDPLTLKHVARTVAHVELSDHIIDVVFTLFDENQDGQLSNREFVAVMKNRLMRGLEKPKDTGFFKLLTSIGRCAKESLPR